MEKEGGSGSVTFPIIATRVGNIKLKFTAVADSAADAVERRLLVEVWKNGKGFRYVIYF